MRLAMMKRKSAMPNKILNTDTMSEILTLRVPVGVGHFLADESRRLGLSRSELLRRAALAYIKSHRDAE